jgi:hypothetical protein
MREDGWTKLIAERKDSCDNCRTLDSCFSPRPNSEVVVKAINKAKTHIGDFVSISLR